jgi:hypothetical protein
MSLVLTYVDMKEYAITVFQGKLKTSSLFVNMFTIFWPYTGHTLQKFTYLLLSESKMIIGDLSKYVFYANSIKSCLTELQTSFIMNSYV